MNCLGSKAGLADGGVGKLEYAIDQFPICNATTKDFHDQKRF